MQTFIPFANHIETAKSLDYRRLGKQRVESYQIMRALTIPGYGWATHPAVLMWEGHLDALATYTQAIITEWIARGYKSVIQDTIKTEFPTLNYACYDMPSWWGRPSIHNSHKAMLYKKDETFYSHWQEYQHITDYVWPIQKK